MKIYIETDRIILREMMPNDCHGMFELDSNPIVHKYLGNKPVNTIADSKKAIDYIRNQYINQGVGRWALIEKSTGAFMGWSGLKLNFEKPINGHINYYDIGYRLIPKYWGKGYATESAIATMDYGFKTMHLETIVGLADINNVPSNTILKKIGLKYIEDFTYEDQEVSWYELKNKDYAKNMS